MNFSYIYLLLLIISFIQIKICLDKFNKVHGMHYIVFCILSSYTILMYYFESACKDVNAIMNFEQAIYAGMLFVPLIVFNIISEICRKKRTAVYYLIVAATFSIVLMDVTTQFHGLFLEKIELIENNVVIHYGPLHKLYFLHLLSVSGCVLYYIFKNKDSNKVSHISLMYVVATIAILFVSVLCTIFMKTHFEFDTAALVFCSAVLLKLCDRLSLYDVNSVMNEGLENNKETGVIILDHKRRFLGYSGIRIDIEGISEYSVDRTIPKNDYFYPLFNEMMDRIDNHENNISEVVEYNGNYLYIISSPLIINSNNKGYQFNFRDITATENNIQNMQKTIRKKEEESNKYLNILNESFDPHLVSGIINNTLKDGENRETVIMFADISGFTSISENKDPKDVVSMLNRYLSMAKEMITSENGIIDKYIGDCVMAFWPKTDENIRKSCNAALKIIETSESLCDDITFSIGIHAGMCVWGYVGDEKHHEFTIIGDAVNTASRIESQALKGRIYLSKAISDSLTDDYIRATLGEKRFKGKAEMVKIYELIKKNS